MLVSNHPSRSPRVFGVQKLYSDLVLVVIGDCGLGPCVAGLWYRFTEEDGWRADGKHCMHMLRYHSICMNIYNYCVSLRKNYFIKGYEGIP